ncbi:hypothetical protein RB195_015890 [Necator americanus]
MFWKKEVKPPEFTLKDVTLAKALPFLSVTITPDVYIIAGTSNQLVNHRVENESPFPVVIKVLATAPKRFLISKNNFFIDQKSSINVEIKLLAGPIRSHRLDFLILPCINILDPNWKSNPVAAFNSPYRPIYRHVRYKAPRPWSTAVDDIFRSTFEISENISKVYEETGIFSSKRENITLNEFIVLDQVFGQNLEKEQNIP